MRLLGEVCAEFADRSVDLGTPRQRCVLAALAVDAGRVVPVDRLVERVWGADAPPRSRSTLHSYISRLRHALVGADGVAIVRRSGGYALITDTTEPVVDLHRFRELRARARGDDGHVVRALTEALALWRGKALTGVGGEWAQAERDRLDQERLTAQHDLADAVLRAGDGRELVAELAARAARHPLDERVAGQYLLALHQAGRTNDALEHHRQVRARLIEELGTEPGTILQDAHRQVLTADAPPTGTSRGAGPRPVVPRQLRAGPLVFAGRHDELHRLDDLVDAARSGGTMVISAITGAGGFGKTWLALRWAHRRLARFPDGQLFVDLRGFDPDSAPMTPTAVLRGFLTALGVAPGAVPSDVHARSALFRSLTADKRVLVVLDNAADTDQVVPLLPGGEACTVVVTSRNQLTGLVTGHGAHRLPLDGLSDDEARELLAARLGAPQVAAQDAAVDELIGLCGGVPLALSVIAARSRVPLSVTVAELRESGLAALDDDDPSASLRAVLSWSLRALAEEHTAALALLAVAPGPDIGLPAAANLTGLPPTAARAVLRSLEQASLLDRDAHGRYRMHDLIRAYATDTARRLPGGVRDAALRRVIDFYAHTAHTADLLLDVHHRPVGLAPPTSVAHPHPLPDAAAATAWFDAERTTLLEAQHLAALQRDHRTVWWLAMSTNTFHHRRGHRHDRRATWQAAAHAAAHLPDSISRIIAHQQLGGACAALGLTEDAVGQLDRAIALAEEHGDPYQQAHAHQALARVRGGRDDREALDHATHALRLLLGLDAPLCQAHAHNAVGWYTARLGDCDTARDHFRTALALHRQHRNATGEANTLDSLGYIEHNTGNHHLAIHHYRQALVLRRALGNVYDAASTLEHLGHPYAALGRHDHARTAWRTALELYRQQGRNDDAEQLQGQLDRSSTSTTTNPPDPQS
ncbi:BTAD domain-containing putative transcriptional regulator [Saccharothrix sp. BKS2]|uniref:AfsR/SARP family transcriptional regulator n=1 Tax=Saccharothrix sp. BKS2 TaxID=3064400 RepID=UPI0039E9183C